MKSAADESVVIEDLQVPCLWKVWAATIDTSPAAADSLVKDFMIANGSYKLKKRAQP